VTYPVGNLKVMLVEEARPYLELQRTFLARHNVSILEAEYDASTLERIRVERPRVAVIDILGPERAGLVLCREIKNDPVACLVPVVLLVEPGDAGAAEAAGADGLVQKPIRMREFLDTIRRFVHLTERRSPRVQVNLRFMYRWDDQTGQAFSREISAYGAFLKTDRQVPEGAVLELRFHLPGEGSEIRCRGVVRKRHGLEAPLASGPGLGVEFEDVEPGDQLRFQHFVDQLCATEDLI
jgi:DNA-binding response OmpR family regulator